MSRVFNNSPFEALDAIPRVQKKTIHDVIGMAYPGEYKSWEFPYVRKGFWNNKEKIKEAIKWLFEERMHIDSKTTIRDCDIVFKGRKLNKF